MASVMMCAVAVWAPGESNGMSHAWGGRTRSHVSARSGRSITNKVVVQVRGLFNQPPFTLEGLHSDDNYLTCYMQQACTAWAPTCVKMESW